MPRLRVPEIEDTIMFSLRWNFSASIVLAILVLGTSLRASFGMKYGTENYYAQALWMVHILDENVHRNVPICGGVIIGESHILTAAQCVWRRCKSIKVVKAEYYFRAGQKLEFIAKSCTILPEYKTEGLKHENDIAVITLETPIASTEVGWAIMKLPSRNVPDGFEGKLFGCSLSRDQKPRLQEMNVSIKDKSEARKIFPSIGDAQMCGVPHGAGKISLGDSGNPLIYENKVVGIVSMPLKHALADLVDPYLRSRYCLSTEIGRISVELKSI